MDKEQCLKLIQLYGEYRRLWDAQCLDYTNRVLREETWRNISHEMNIPIADLKKKMDSLLGSYRREKCREKKSRIKGSGRGKIYISNWYAYKAFSFIRDRAISRRTAILSKTGSALSPEATVRGCSVTQCAANDESEAKEKIEPSQIEHTTNHQNRSNHEEPRGHDELDRFFLHISDTVKKFTPYEQALAKNKIFSFVSEMELQQLAPPTSSPALGVVMVKQQCPSPDNSH